VVIDDLVSAEWLKGHIDDVLVVDTRWTLAGGSSGDAYAAGHIPGAHFVVLGRELADLPAPDRPGRHPLPSAKAFAMTLARIGYFLGVRVVVYDDMGGAIAARFWWLMRYFGLDGAAVLDGGLPAWEAAGGTLSTDEPTVVSGAPLELVPRSELVVDAAAVDELRQSANARVIDSRALDRYRGDREPIDPRAGHIPGAVHGAFADNLVDARFRGTDELRERFAALGAFDADRVVFYCGSGVTACHNVLALTLAGRDDAQLYEGSWSDWSSDPSRPVATGDDA
jgi:thiosulfate/3-mercaptopyruvate sulfurtransferase